MLPPTIKKKGSKQMLVDTLNTICMHVQYKKKNVFTSNSYGTCQNLQNNFV